jgi:hypothetical protein
MEYYRNYSKGEGLGLEHLPFCGQCDEVGELEACIIMAVA